MAKGFSAQADVVLREQRDERFHLSSIKDTIHQLILHRSTELVRELFSCLCAQSHAAPRTSTSVVRFSPLPLPDPVPAQAHQSFHHLLLGLRSLFCFFEFLCSHTTERPSSIDSLQNVEMLKQTVRDLEEQVDAKSLEVQRLVENQACLMAAWVKEGANSTRLIQGYQAELTSLSQKATAFEEQCKVLQGKLEKAEMLQGQKCLVDVSASYEDCAATPLLLRTAADSVKDAIAMFASDLFSNTKKHSISFQTAALGLKNDNERTVPRSAYIRKVALQALVCQIFFRGFEDPYFFTDCRNWPPFEKPEKYRQCMFQSYKKLRDLKPEQMGSHLAEFNDFVGPRVHALCDCLRSLLFKSNVEPDKLHDFVVSEFLNKPDSSVRLSLLRLVKAVWLLQKLALAMEPNAQIFRIAQSSNFDEDFMEDLAPVDELECVNGRNDDCRSPKGANKVSFMCVPGFTVRHTIIKARVVCLKDY